MHKILRDNVLQIDNLKINLNSEIPFEGIGLDIRDHKIIAKKIAEILAHNSELMRCLNDARKIINDYGFVILQGFDFHSLEIGKRKEFLLGLTQLLGDVTYTDEVLKAVIRDIQPRKNAGVENTTISEVAGEACFHTDTQYYPNPEKCFVLACDTPANDGGESWLVDGAKVIEDIKTGNKELYEQLLTLEYPFAVPSSFSRSGTDKSIEIFIAPLIKTGENPPLIRYREDTILRGSRILPQLFTENHKNTFEEFQSYLNQEYRLLKFDLERNQIVIVNNHELLHGRGNFTDMNRLLYRIRMN